MEMFGLILALSTVIWYIVDRFKGNWAKYSFGKFITIGLAGIMAAGACFTYHLDIIYALGLDSASSIMGEIITLLLIMSGSSAISEIIGKIKG